jgi:hypothetical protein
MAVAEGQGFERVSATPDLWGRWVESAVGAELLARHLTHTSTQPLIYYWNDGSKEVDFVLRAGRELFALEVKSGHQPGNVSGLDAFRAIAPNARPMVLGTGGLPLESWFSGAGLE